MSANITATYVRHRWESAVEKIRRAMQRVVSSSSSSRGDRENERERERGRERASEREREHVFVLGCVKA